MLKEAVLDTHATAALREPAWLAFLRNHDPFSWGYLACPAPEHVLRLAHGLRVYWAHAAADIGARHRILGRLTPRGVGAFDFGSGIHCRHAEADELSRAFPQWSDHLRALTRFWDGLHPGHRVVLPPDESFCGNLNVYWAGWGGHAILDYAALLATGTEGIRERIRLAETRDSTPEQQVFRQALGVVCAGIDGFAATYAQAAGQLALETMDAHRRAELEACSQRCLHVPRHGARTFPEALQSMWFVHVLDGCDSPGRLDQFAWPYLEADLRAGVLSQSEAQEWVDHLWERFEEHRSWNVCVGGVRADGSDAANPLTYMALDAMRRSGNRAPNLSLRLHRQSSTELWRAGLASIATGCGMPALYNDEVIVPSLMSLGIPAPDARDYAMNGCSQIDIPGRSHMGLEDGEINLLKCLELALYDGVDPRTGKQIGPHTGQARSFDTYAQVLTAYKAQVETFVQRLVTAANAVQKAHAETSPNLLRSLLTSDCIDRGVDFKAGGPRYNHGQILTQGIANTADSLAVIKALVVDAGSVTWDELLGNLARDFPDEAFRQQLRRRAPAFGNGDDTVDGIARDIVEHLFRCLGGHRTWRGGIYGGGAIVFTRGIEFGRQVGATPDGRRSGTPLADSVGPSAGRDVHGPTALLQSVSRVPQELARSAYVLNVKCGRRAFSESAPAVLSLLRTYFALGGQQLQVNAVDAGMLLQAQAHPEQYAGLIVRVGGYSEYFSHLTRDLQDDVIGRTEQVI